MGIPKTIVWRIRVDATSEADRIYLSSKPWFVNLSHFVREALSKAALREHERDAQITRAINRANEPEPQPVEPYSKASLADQHYGKPEPDLINPGQFRPYLNLHPHQPGASSHPLKRLLPATIEDSDNT